MKKLRSLRVSAGLSRLELAALAKISVDSIRAYEVREVSPTLRTIHKLARALRCDPAALL